MSLPRVLILDLLTRYPDAATLDDAVAQHVAILKAAVDAKWAELDTATREYDAFQKYAGGAPIIGAAPPVPPAVEPSIACSIVTISGRPVESRTRPGTQVTEYLYSSRLYLTNARRLGVGTLDESGTRMWLSRHEVALCRKHPQAAAQADGKPAHFATRQFFRSRDERVRKGTAIKERCYASGEYIAYASRHGLGTVEGKHVYLTDMELQQIRQISRVRAIERGAAP